MTTKTLSQKIALIESCTPFSRLDAPVLRGLAERAKVRVFKAGEQIFVEGSPGESMMLNDDGVVRISALAPTARDVILTELSQGDIFGEIAVIDGGARSADAHALTDCRVLILERTTLMQVMQSAPGLAIALLELLCAHLRRTNDRMMAFAFLQLPRRLARTILGLAEGGMGGEDSAKLAQSQSDLADMIGGSRENVNRCLRKWQSDGLIRLTKGGIVLLDRGQLKRISETD